MEGSKKTFTDHDSSKSLVKIVPGSNFPLKLLGFYPCESLKKVKALVGDDPLCFFPNPNHQNHRTNPPLLPEIRTYEGKPMVSKPLIKVETVIYNLLKENPSLSP